MIVSKVHLIRIDDLSTASTTPSGVHARVELGEIGYLDINQEHQICFLTWAAKSIQLVGTVPRVLDSLERAVVEYSADQVSS